MYMVNLIAIIKKITQKNIRKELSDKIVTRENIHQIKKQYEIKRTKKASDK